MSRRCASVWCIYALWCKGGFKDVYVWVSGLGFSSGLMCVNSADPGWWSDVCTADVRVHTLVTEVCVCVEPAGVINLPCWSSFVFTQKADCWSSGFWAAYVVHTAFVWNCACMCTRCMRLCQGDGCQRPCSPRGPGVGAETEMRLASTLNLLRY